MPQDSTRFSVVRFMRKVVLFAYGYFLLFLFRDDMIRHYIHERYQVLTVVASVALIAAAVAYSSIEKTGARHDHDHCGCGDRDHEHAHAHFQGGGPVKSAVTGVLFLLLAAFVMAPIVWGFIAPPEVLGASSSRLKHRFSFGQHSSIVDPEALRTRGPGDRTLKFPTENGKKETFTYSALNVMELNYLLMSGDGENYVGDRVAVQGFVYHEDDNTENEFTLVRYQVPCCIVHAHPVAIFVQSLSASELPTEQWVVVYGVIRAMDVSEHHPDMAADNDGHEDEKDHAGHKEHARLPFYIEAERIDIEKTPSDPYINRWFMKKPFQF